MSDTHGTANDNASTATPAPTPADRAPIACAYCHTPFEETDLWQLTDTDGAQREIARCGQCSAVHRMINTQRFFAGQQDHDTLCPGNANDFAEPHPTEDNTPWGYPACRHCTVADPFTHLQGFVSTVVLNAKAAGLEMTRLLQQNTDIVERASEVDRVNKLVHEQMASVMQAFGCSTVDDALVFGNRELPAIRALLTCSWTDIDFDYGSLTDREQKCVDRDTFERLVTWLRREQVGSAEMQAFLISAALTYASTIAVTQRFHGSVYIGKDGPFDTISEVARIAFLAGVKAAMRGAL